MMRDCRVLVLLGLCLLHSVCYGKPLDNKRSRVSTKAILKLESQLKDMAGEDDKPTIHRTTAKAPLILPVDETEDSPPVNHQEDNQPEDNDLEDNQPEENQPEDNQPQGILHKEEGLEDHQHDEPGVEDLQQAQPEEFHSEQEPIEEMEKQEGDPSDVGGRLDDIPDVEAELFGKILAMTGEHPELLDMSVDDFQAILQRIQEREKEAELYAQARDPQEDEEDQNMLSPEEMRERIQWLKGDEDAKIVAKKNMYPPVDILRRRAEELQETAMAKRQPEVINKKSVEE